MASDFDGTLAPIVSHPDRAVGDPRALQSLIRLARRDRVTVAIVSGRAFGELKSLLGEAAGIVLIGEHGNDLGEEFADQAEAVEEMAAYVRGVGRTVPGSAVEVKRQGVGFHYRRAEEVAAGKAIESLLAWAEERPDIKVTEGKKLIEMSVASHHKGDAVMALKSQSGAECVVFIGDDTTDENVFAMLGPSDIGIKVGPGDSAARYRVEDISDVVEVLSAIESAVG